MFFFLSQNMRIQPEKNKWKTQFKCFFFFVKFYGIIFFGLVFELRFGLSSTKYLIGWHADRHCVSMVYGKWSLWMPINWAFMLMKKTISNGNDKKMMMMYIDGLDDDGDGISIFFFFYTAPPPKKHFICALPSLYCIFVFFSRCLNFVVSQ